LHEVCECSEEFGEIIVCQLGTKYGFIHHDHSTLIEMYANEDIFESGEVLFRIYVQWC